ncbi:MAG: hypothetical protein Q4G63_12575 [Bacteroidia bacterium]|nr:hypothetical protein [Bacteroidia bacterium]
MDLAFEIKNNIGFISFIPVEFFSLERIFQNYEIKKILKIEIGYFNPNDEEDYKYYNLKNYKELFKINTNINTISNIISLINFQNREDFNIYKISLDFGKFKMLYDDDSYLIIEGSINTIADYILFHNLYLKIYQEYIGNAPDLAIEE